MKRTALIAASALFFIAQIAVFAQDYRIPSALTDWLTAKKYDGDKRQYAQADLNNVPADVMNSLNNLGVSHFTILRNEMYARHGYIFKTPVLLAIYSKVPWYSPDSKIGLNALSALEARNVTWIKGIEDEYDYNVVIDFMSKRNYVADIKLYSTSSAAETAPLDIPLSVTMAFNHLYINPAQFFRNEIFARNGSMYIDGLYKKIFSRTPWYKPLTTNDDIISRQLNNFERANLALLREREWVEIVNAVKFSLPDGVTSIPVIGFNTLFVKNVKTNGRTYHFSFPDAWTAMEENGTGLDEHVTDVDSLVEPIIVEKIKTENDSAKKLILFFNNKKYKGYANTIQFNSTDMATPSYLFFALQDLGLDWRLLLRKEIHARNGAKFIDPKVGPIFRACSWYKAKYDLNPRTVSRFPGNVKITNQELRNYSLLEGEELATKMAALNQESQEAVKACDLQGNYYFIKIGSVKVGDGENLEVGHGFRTLKEYYDNDLQSIINALAKPFDFNLELYREQEQNYFVGGC